jgi:putative membrane protein insertion efficiency factor
MKRKKNIHIFPDTDPRSINYNRTLDFPDINWPILLSKIILPIPITVCLCLFLKLLFDTFFARFIALVSVLVYSIFNIKKIILSSVKIYQRVAPQKIRLKCRFEPSCSQYMILAVEKYGAIKGVYKGIKRLSKCNNRGDGLSGGYDYP